MSTDLSAAFIKAESFVANNDIQSALLIYAAILEQWPENEDALAAFESIMLGMSKSNSPKDPTQQQIDHIMTLCDQRQLPVALSQANELRQEFPCSVILNMIIARIALDIESPGLAIESLLRVTELDPFYAEGFNNLGVVFQQVDRLDESVEALKQALAIRPNYASAHNSLANSLNMQKRLDESVDSFQMAIQIDPNFFDAHNNLGLVLCDKGRYEESTASFRRAIELEPRSALSHSNLSIALKALGRLDEALKSCRIAHEIDPTSAEVCSNLGALCKDAGRYAESIITLRKAISLKPNYAEGHNNLAERLRGLGQDHEALDNYSRAIELNPDYTQAFSNRQYCMSHMEDVSPAEQLASAADYGKVISSQVGARYSSWPVKSASDKLVIGFVSGDFRSHPVGFAVEGLLAGIDRSQFELVAFTSDVREDALTARIKPLFSVWVEIFGQDDQSAAELIHRHGVDILIDLSGHTAGNRLPLFAYKAAPVQVSWLGYWSTTGVAEIDYKLGDNFLTPADQDEFFSEQIWRLPNSFLCFAPPAADLPVVPLPAIKTGQVTFGCFNQYSKVTDKVIAVWCDILSGVRGSRLVLKMSALSDDKVVESARARFAVHGISGDQLVLEGGAPYEEYLASYQDIDIALDPFPYPGGATTIESLWMAVPVLTKRGGLLPLSRQGASLMHNTGLSDWIAADDEDYIAKALAFAGDIDALSYLRAGLRQQVLASPLFDSKRFAGDFEIAMQGMWARYSG